MTSKSTLWQYAVVLHKTKMVDGKEVYEGSEMVLPLTTVLAKTEKEVLFKVTREIPPNKAENPDNIEIMIQSF